MVLVLIVFLLLLGFVAGYSWREWSSRPASTPPQRTPPEAQRSAQVSRAALHTSSTLTHEQVTPREQVPGRTGREFRGLRNHLEVAPYGLDSLGFSYSWRGAPHLSSGTDRIRRPMWRAVSSEPAAQVANGAQVANREEYAVVVGRLRVSSNVVSNADLLSRADLRVTIMRLDPVVLAELDAINEEIRARRRNTDTLRSRAALLHEKERLSERQPGPPLTEQERARLAELSALPSGRAGVSQRSELERLQRKQDESVRPPGPPLTVAETTELSELRAQLERSHAAISAAEQNRDRLRESIPGHTSIFNNANSNTVVFNEVLVAVYPGDTLRVVVLDDDAFENDVVGTFRTLRETSLPSAGLLVILEV